MSFWANKLNGTSQPAPAPVSNELFGLYKPVTTPDSAPQQQSIPSTQDYVPSVRLKQGSVCPGCGSDKYMTYGSYAVACGECGYHPRFEQTGYGESSLAAEKGQVKAARQSGDRQTMASEIAVLNAGGGTHING